jgi:hypothetical protein
MTVVYFPILEPDEGEQYSPEYAFTESLFKKAGPSQAAYEKYKVERWRATFQIFNQWLNAGAWQAAKLYRIGDVVVPSSPGFLIYQCVTSGVSGAGEPTWGTTAEGTTADGGVLWSAFDDNPITALLNFIDNRKGRTKSFYVYIPIIEQWVQSVFPVNPIAFVPLKSGLYKIANVEIEFESTLSGEYALTETGDLVAWYKINERSGLVVANSANPTDAAEKWPDLTVKGNTSYFWARRTGFGSSGMGDEKAHCQWNGADSILTCGTSGSMSMFMRFEGRNEDYPKVFNCQIEADNDNQDSDVVQLELSIYGPGTDYHLYAVHGGYGSLLDRMLLFYNDQINRWLFYFMFYDPVLDAAVFGAVKDNGTLITGTRNGTYGNSRAIKQINLFRGWDPANVEQSFLYGQLGDVMYWRNSKLTLASWAAIYDSLRSRYGMAARSGW